jgi:ATP-binding cassette subfamily B protein
MKTIKFIFNSLSIYRKMWFFMVYAIFYVALDKTMKPYLIKNIIDLVNVGNFHDIWHYIVIFIIMQFLLVAAWYLYDWCKARLEPGLSRIIAQNIMDKIEKYPYNFFQNNLSGKIASRFSDLGRYVPKLLDTATCEFFLVMLLILISLIMIGRISLFLGASMALWITVFVAMTLWSFAKANKMSRLKAEAYNDTWANITDCIANILQLRFLHVLSMKNPD